MGKIELTKDVDIKFGGLFVGADAFDSESLAVRILLVQCLG
jgi:hypothetical protein